MAHVKVDYTHKRPSHLDPHRRIEGIAGEGVLGWYRTESEVIADITNRTNSYFVRINGIEVDVIVAKHDSRLYIKTRSDGYAPNNLLQLPEPPQRLLAKRGQ